MTTLLQATNLHASYGATKVLHGLNISLKRGQVTAILGANGAGKTTTLRAISGMVKTEGEITFEGKSIRSCKTEDIARLGIAHIPDDRGTFLQLTVEENLRLGAYVRKDKANIKNDFDLVYSYFPRLKERMKQQAGTLSGGEQQMLAIGRALMLRPTLLLLDEPSFGLAPLIVQEIFRILKSINQTEKVSMLLVEQNAALALAFATHAYLLETGHTVLSGTTEDIKSDEAIRRAYLGS
jgi:branched-chain amino acid transport system ATP-binding protein